MGRRKAMPLEKSIRAYEQDYWDEFVTDAAPDILGLGGVCIAGDSGFADIGKLLYGLQYAYAAMALGFALTNLCMISRADVPEIFAPEVDANLAGKFLLSKLLLGKVVGPSADAMDYLVPLCEFSYLVFLVIRIIRYAIMAVIAPICFRQHWQLRRWSYVQSLFWTYFPSLTCFSAMRVLYYVTPSVMGTEAYEVAYLMRQRLECALAPGERFRALLPMAHYIISRLACLVVGFDAFLVKFRMTASYTNAREATLEGFLASAVFLFQLLAVVNVGWFVRERLFIFTFAGEDGNLDSDEKARKEVWNALLAKRIYEHFGLWKFVVVMLGFDDYDFQMLVLDVRERQQRKTV